MSFFFKQKTSYERRISDWSSDVCSSDLSIRRLANFRAACGYRDIRGNRIFSLGPPNHLPLGLLGPFVEGPADHPTLLEIPGSKWPHGNFLLIGRLILSGVILPGGRRHRQTARRCRRGSPGKDRRGAGGGKPLSRPD